MQRFWLSMHRSPTQQSCMLPASMHMWVEGPSKRISRRRVLEARRGYQAMLSARLAPSQALTPAASALVACAALFERLAALT